MNIDVETELGRIENDPIYKANGRTDIAFLDDMLRQAMRWAYADAARIGYDFGHSVGQAIAQAIEDRAK